MPGVPAIQHFGPRTARAAKSNHARRPWAIRSAESPRRAPDRPCVQHQAAFAHQPAVGRPSSRSWAKLRNSNAIGADRFDFAAADQGQRPVAAGQHAGAEIEEVGGHPARGRRAGQWPPASPAVVGHKHAGGIHGRAAARGPAVPRVEETDPPQGRQHELGDWRPSLSAVAGGQHDARAVVGVGVGESAGRPAE